MQYIYTVSFTNGTAHSVFERVCRPLVENGVSYTPQS